MRLDAGSAGSLLFQALSPRRGDEDLPRKAKELALRREQCVPGTIKERGDCLYCVPMIYQTEYLELVRNTLTASRLGGAPSPAVPDPLVPTYTL